MALRAHTCGALDFRESDRFSPQWELKREFVFEQLENDNLLKIRMMRQALHAAASAYGSPETYKNHFEHSVAEIISIGELLFPWIDWKTGGKADEYKKLWEESYGIQVGSPEWEALEREGEMLGKMFNSGGRQTKRMIS